MAKNRSKKIHFVSTKSIYKTKTWWISYLLLLGFVFFWPKFIFAILIGAILAILINPVARYLTQLGMFEADAAALVVIVLIIMVLSIVHFTYPILFRKTFINPASSSQVQIRPAEENENINTITTTQHFVKLIKQKILRLGLEWHRGLKGLLYANFNWQVVLLLLFSQIILKSSKHLRRELYLNIPNRHFEFLAALDSNISKKLFSYFRIEIAHSLLTGFLISIALTLLGFPFPISYGLFAALTAMIPRWGWFLGISLPVVESYVLTGTMVHLIGLAIAFATTVLLCHILFAQSLCSHRPKIPFIYYILFPIVGELVLGVWGLLLSIPFVSVFRLLWISIDDVVVPGE